MHSSHPPQPPLLRIPPSIRRRILVLAGLPHHDVFYMDSPWRHDHHPRGDYGPTTTKSFHAAKDKMKALRPGLDLTISLLLTCKAISSEANALFYADNTFITKDPEPLLNLGTQSLASLTDLHVLLTSLRCVSEYLCKDFYPWDDDIMTTLPEVGRSALEAWEKLAPFLGRSVNRDHRLNLSLRGDLIHYTVPTQEELENAERILAGLACFPPLASCRIKLGTAKRIDMKMKALRQMSRKAARKATFQEDFRSRPFRYMDLPVDIRLRVLEFTDLIANQEVLVWSVGHRYHLEGWLDFGEKCRQFRFGRPTENRDWFCQTIGGYTPTCRCWDHPAPLFLVSRAFLAEARRVFYGNHHIQVSASIYGVKGDKYAFAGYAGNEFASKVLEPPLWGVLQSLSVELHALSDHDRDASHLAEWWRVIKSARALAAPERPNLRFLRLNIRTSRSILAPDMKKIAALEPEPRIDALRRNVHGWFWPLDAGEASSLPFGARHLEAHIHEASGIALYRCRQLKQARPLSPAERKLNKGDDSYMYPKIAVTSRVLLGGGADRHCRPEPGDSKAYTDADWMEDVWFRVG